MDESQIKQMVRARYGGIAAASEISAVLCAGRVLLLRADDRRPRRKGAADGLFRGRACSGPGRRQSRARLRQPAGDRRDPAGRDDCRSRQRRRVRLFSGGAAGGAARAGHRRRHDPRDAGEGARQRRPDRRRQCRIPARRTRASADRRQHRRCRDLELRDQPRPRQGAGVSRGVSGAEARRPARRLRHRQYRAIAGRSRGRPGAPLRVRRRRRLRRADRGMARRRRLRRCPRCRQARNPRADRELGAGARESRTTSSRPRSKPANRPPHDFPR